MDHVHFRFHGDLNDLLRPDRRNVDIVYPLSSPSSVKHPIEALGVPHTEVDLILANRRPVGFEYPLLGQDFIDLFPPGHAMTAGQPMILRPPLPRPVRFVVDTHLGQLASYLRLLGFDTWYRNDFDDPELARISSNQARLLLTRDRGLLKRGIVVYGYCVRSTDPRRQLIDLLVRYQLAPSAQPWSRCVRCNGLLLSVDKAEIIERLQPLTRLYYDEFRQCQDCGQIFWQGSHYQRTRCFVDDLLAEVKEMEQA